MASGESLRTSTTTTVLCLLILFKSRILDSTWKNIVSEMSFDLGGGAMRQNVLHVCKIGLILMHLALVIILINLTASVKIIYDALKMIGP